jgi:hypothetical protein
MSKRSHPRLLVLSTSDNGTAFDLLSGLDGPLLSVLLFYFVFYLLFFELGMMDHQSNVLLKVLGSRGSQRLWRVRKCEKMTGSCLM